MDDPYETLANEMEAGKHAAEALVRHLRRMGAERGTIPIEVDGKGYLVCVEEVTVLRVNPFCKN